MSWDVLLMHAPPEMRSVEDMDQDFRPPVLGEAGELRHAIQTLFPKIDFSDPTWGRLDGPDFWIEWNMGKDHVVDTIMLHVRGGDGAVQIIQYVCREMGWRALDISSGEFLDAMPDPAAGFHAWRAYRDHVIASSAADGPGAASELEEGK